MKAHSNFNCEVLKRVASSFLNFNATVRVLTFLVSFICCWQAVSGFRPCHRPQEVFFNPRCLVGGQTHQLKLHPLLSSFHRTAHPCLKQMGGCSRQIRGKLLYYGHNSAYIASCQAQCLVCKYERSFKKVNSRKYNIILQDNIVP